jgi:hypothetical protein
MAETITRETKREGQKKVKRYTTHRNQKKRRELIPFVVGNYLTHGPSTVACMQVVRSNRNGRLEQASPTNVIFLSITKVKAL